MSDDDPGWWPVLGRQLKADFAALPRRASVSVLNSTSTTLQKNTYSHAVTILTTSPSCLQDIEEVETRRDKANDTTT